MTSIYDNIPTLDIWYQSKNSKGPEPYQVVPCGKQRTNSNNNTVSFSTAPPAVYCYDNKQQNLERPFHRRNSSSEQVKELLKHYTNKLSRQLSYTSQSTYR